MTGLRWVVLGVLGVLGTLGMTVISDMVSEEVRDRLDQLPHAILRLAARRLDPEQRASAYEEVWLPDLAYYLKGEEARPVTRLLAGTWFAIGILAKGRRIERHLSPAAQDQPTATGTDDEMVRITAPKPDFVLVTSSGQRVPIEVSFVETKPLLYVDGTTRLSAIRSLLDSLSLRRNLPRG